MASISLSFNPKKIENKHAKEKDLGLQVFHHTSNYKLNVNMNTDFSAACRTPQHLYQIQQYFHSNWEVSTEVKVRGWVSRADIARKKTEVHLPVEHVFGVIYHLTSDYVVCSFKNNQKAKYGHCPAPGVAVFQHRSVLTPYGVCLRCLANLCKETAAFLPVHNAWI